MKIEEIKSGIYIACIKLAECYNGENYTWLYVKVFNVNLKENFIEVHLVGQPRNTLFPLKPEQLIECSNF